VRRRPPHADPLPQALILTAIVIGFGVQAFALVLIRRVYRETGTDDLDALGRPTRERPRRPPGPRARSPRRSRASRSSPGGRRPSGRRAWGRPACSRRRSRSSTGSDAKGIVRSCRWGRGPRPSGSASWPTSSPRSWCCSPASLGSRSPSTRRTIDAAGRPSATTRSSTSCWMGVCMAFLTGDLFNLYVWFEVLLMASFVLCPRRRAGAARGGRQVRHAQPRGLGRLPRRGRHPLRRGRDAEPGRPRPRSRGERRRTASSRRSPACSSSPSASRPRSSRSSSGCRPPTTPRRSR
jgi:hypothetical protein